MIEWTDDELNFFKKMSEQGYGEPGDTRGPKKNALYLLANRGYGDPADTRGPPLTNGLNWSRQNFETEVIPGIDALFSKYKTDYSDASSPEDKVVVLDEMTGWYNAFSNFLSSKKFSNLKDETVSHLANAQNAYIDCLIDFYDEDFMLKDFQTLTQTLIVNNDFNAKKLLIPSEDVTETISAVPDAEKRKTMLNLLDVIKADFYAKVPMSYFEDSQK